MQQLTKAEEQLMEQLWNWRKLLWKIYFQTFPDKTKTTTVANFTQTDDRCYSRGTMSLKL
jgi:hypothetical protein